MAGRWELRQWWHKKFGHRWEMPTLEEVPLGYLTLSVHCPCGTFRLRGLEDIFPQLCDYLWIHAEDELRASCDRMLNDGW